MPHILITGYLVQNMIKYILQDSSSIQQHSTSPFPSSCFHVLTTFLCLSFLEPVFWALMDISFPLPTERSLSLFSSYLSLLHTHQIAVLSAVLPHLQPPFSQRPSIPSAAVRLAKSSYPICVPQPKGACSQDWLRVRNNHSCSWFSSESLPRQRERERENKWGLFRVVSTCHLSVVKWQIATNSPRDSRVLSHCYRGDQHQGRWVFICIQSLMITESCIWK